MVDDQLYLLAQTAGLSIDWTDAHNQSQKVSPEVLRAVLAELDLPANTHKELDDSLARLLNTQSNQPPPLLTADLQIPLNVSRWFQPRESFRLIYEDGQCLDGQVDDRGWLPGTAYPGYHQLHIGETQVTLAVAPLRCPKIQGRQGRAWGLTAQIYGLRSPEDAGLGDTQALEELTQQAAHLGADALAISPLHAMFTAYPQQYSPYSPSSRLFFNPLYAAPAQILGQQAWKRAVHHCGLEKSLATLKQQPLVDWLAVSDTRMRLLRQLFADFNLAAPIEQQEAFRQFCVHGGQALLHHCRFEVLHSALLNAKGQPSHWRNWPQAYQDPESSTVLHFSQEHAEEIKFHAFAQWLVTAGLDRVQQSAKAAGMTMGLIADLAVGADGGGSQAWSRQAELLASLSVGAPPDVLNQHGQNWGISAFSPQGLRDNGYRAFIEMLGANLAHAGGMRIDHVMGLLRLWVMPAGANPMEGVYLSYPFQDLLRLLTLEAYRHQAVILGEDLGTIPSGLRDNLAARNILGMRVLLFEGNHEGYLPPPQYWSVNAVATTTTHDVPPITGWWQCTDIDWRIKVGQNPAAERDQEWMARAQQRAKITHSLQAGLGWTSEKSITAKNAVDACTQFLGRTPSALVLLPLEDVFGLAEQPNMPGITTVHPNWCRRYPENTAQQLTQSPACEHLAHLAEARQRDPN